MSAWDGGFQALVPQEVGGQVEPFDLGLVNPGDCQVETAFGHSRRLGVRGEDPFVDTDPRVGNCFCLRRQPTDVAQPQRQFTGSIAGPIERPCRGAQHLSGIGQELAAGGRQFDVSAVADEELRPKLTFEIADLLRERRPSKVEPRGGPTEMQFLGNGDEVAKVT